jgi:hypothetical protein
MLTQEAIMTTQEVANRFHELAQTAQWGQIHDELYADDAMSLEPEHSQGLQSAKGMEMIRQKMAQFQGMVEEMHGGYSNEPIVAGNHFAVAMGMDVSIKGMGRMKMDEIAVYEVKNGKIVKEQFFY